jgi:hypothetical protein
MMTPDNLSWFQTDAAELANLVFNATRKPKSPLNFSEISLSSVDIALGYDASPSSTYTSPALIILRDESVPKILGWLKVYAPEAYPLTQFARVMARSDMDMSYQTPSTPNRHDKWACIILGELLGQSGMDVDPAALPLSRAAACYSTPIARAKILHANPDATRLCGERLRVIERDDRFFRRPVTVDELTTVWSLMTAVAPFGDEPSAENPRNLIFSIVETIATYEEKVRNANQVRLHNYPDLIRDSVEGRVLAFQKLARDVAGNASPGQRLTIYQSALLAGGAYLVGRGTSHVALLNDLSAIAPMAFVWFGLIAAVHGAHGWDKSWARLVKGVERQLRLGLDWADPAMVDLCWVEYLWASKAFNSKTSLGGIVPLNAKALTIEFLPGVACQFRLAGEDARTPANQPASGAFQTTIAATPPPSKETNSPSIPTLSVEDTLRLANELNAMALRVSELAKTTQNIAMQARDKSSDKPVRASQANKQESLDLPPPQASSKSKKRTRKSAK